MSDHTILRTYEKDSAITYAIFVIEPKENYKKNFDFWDLIDKNKNQFEEQQKKILINKINSDLINYSVRKINFKNNHSLLEKCEYTIKNIDYEYNNTSISILLYKENYFFTFALEVPTKIFDLKPDYYYSLFERTYILTNKSTKEIINNYLNK